MGSSGHVDHNVLKGRFCFICNVPDTFLDALNILDSLLSYYLLLGKVDWPQSRSCFSGCLTRRVHILQSSVSMTLYSHNFVQDSYWNGDGQRPELYLLVSKSKNQHIRKIITACHNMQRGFRTCSVTPSYLERHYSLQAHRRLAVNEGRIACRTLLSSSKQ